MQRTIYDLSDKELVEYFTEGCVEESKSTIRELSADPNNLMEVAGMILDKYSIAADSRIIAVANFLRYLGIGGIDDYASRIIRRDDIVNAVADEVAASQSWLGSET